MAMIPCLLDEAQAIPHQQSGQRGEDSAMGEQVFIKEMTRETFTHHRQPYGTLELKDVVFTPIKVETHGDTMVVRYCESKNLGTVKGEVIKGGTTNRIFNHTSFVSMVGEIHEVWAVSSQEWDQGSKVTVAG